MEKYEDDFFDIFDNILLEEDNKNNKKPKIKEDKKTSNITKSIKRNKTREKLKQKKKEQGMINKIATQNMTKEEKDVYYNNLRSKALEIKNAQRKAKDSPFKIIFDLDYNIHMGIEEIKSLAIQIGYCYGLNKHIKTKICYYLSNFQGDIKREINKMGGEYWHVNFIEGEFFNNKELIALNKEFVYLSPDSKDDLEEVSEDKIYIIGGLVDKPVIKDQSLKRAQMIKEENTNIKIKTNRLPLLKFIDNLFNPALNINTVVEILSNYIDSRDWKYSIENALPQRNRSKNK